MSSATAAATSSEQRGLGASTPEVPRPRLERLTAVPGFRADAVNDLLLLRPEATGGGDGGGRHVVFFHGDIQDFADAMRLQPEAAPWLCWSLEQVARVLGRRFPGHHVWVVRASAFHLHKFSCYRNFVPGNLFGAPEHRPWSPLGGAFLHLRFLLGHAMERAGLPLPPCLGPASPDLSPVPFSLTLVGFSKGCVVLNQLLYEMGGARLDPRTAPLLSSVSDMFWLDGGHAGGSDTWVTDREVLGELAASGVSVHAHVTPYEVCDPMRAWVGREHRLFVQTLRELGAQLRVQLHFHDQPPSIQNHFRVILEF